MNHTFVASMGGNILEISSIHDETILINLCSDRCVSIVAWGSIATFHVLSAMMQEQLEEMSTLEVFEVTNSHRSSEFSSRSMLWR